MNKERTILLRILSLMLLLPLIMFIYYNVSNIRTDKELLTRYASSSGDINLLQSEIFALDLQKEEIQSKYENLASSLFSENELKFYEFCDFIIDSAKNRGAKIDNYSTNESSTPKRINLSAEGDIRNLLSFLQYLYLFEKKIDINQMSISYNSNSSDYKLSMLINFITVNKPDEE